MVDTSLTVLDQQLNKLYDAIIALDNDYEIVTYTPEIKVIRGKYGFNILPQDIFRRVFSGQNSLKNLVVFVYMHYDLEADDQYIPRWQEFMIRGQAVLSAIYDKTNFIDGISTVDVDVAFDNIVAEKLRRISITFQCEYKMFATR